MGEQRTFTPIGDRMIMCDLPCPAQELGEFRPQVSLFSGDTGIVTDPPNNFVPLCHAPGAPLQFEITPAGGDFPISTRRACVLQAGYDGIGMEELPKIEIPSLTPILPLAEIIPLHTDKII
jgi:hypothetical protein